MITARRLHRGLAAAVVLCSLSTFALVAAARLNKTGSSTTSFRVTGPAGTNITGTTGEMSIADDGTTVTITVPLANLKTGIALHDKTARDALAVDQYPNATLAVARSALKAGGGAGDATGAMTLHGRTKNVTFHYTAAIAGGTYTVNGSATIMMTDFGITPPTVANVTAKPEVGIETTFQVKDN